MPSKLPQINQPGKLFRAQAGWLPRDLRKAHDEVPKLPVSPLKPGHEKAVLEQHWGIKGTQGLGMTQMASSAADRPGIRSSPWKGGRATRHLLTAARFRGSAKAETYSSGSKPYGKAAPRAEHPKNHL